tara:strand:- start:695 stop:2383 length:1689 start_codon:yes stop_codon:yes gene_type:complete
MKYYKANFAILFTVMILSSCSGGGMADDDGSNTSILPSNLVTVSISVNPTKIFIGDSAVVSWTSTNTSSCIASGSWSGVKPASGSESFAMTVKGNQVFTITCGNVSSYAAVTVSSEDFEGSCNNPHSADIYESYLGKYIVPMPQNTFGEAHLKAIGLKDYGVEWIYGNYKNSNVGWIENCTENQYIKLMYRTTLRRLNEHGVRTVWVYNFGYWEDKDADSWKINHSSKHIDDWVIEFINTEAQKLGINIHYAWQFLTLDIKNEQLFPFDGNVRVDMPLLKKIMDAHEMHILWEADRLESLGVASMSADWSAMWMCFECGISDQGNTQADIDDLKNYYMERQGSIINQIKEIFSGKIYVGEGIQWNDKRVFEKVDGIIFNFSNLLKDDEVATASVDLLQERAEKIIQRKDEEWNCLNEQPCWSNSSSTIPKVIFNLFSQSTSRFLSKGWVEDGFCTEGKVNDIAYDCMQYELATDFSAQAIFTEAILRAIKRQVNFEILGTTSSTGYWLSDTLIPDKDQYPAITNTIEGFPNISQSIRGKPAEKILKYWYKGEYEEYSPDFAQ